MSNEKAILKCTQEELLDRFFALVDNKQLNIDTIGKIMGKIIESHDLVPFDQYRKQLHLSEDAMEKRINAEKTMCFIFKVQ